MEKTQEKGFTNAAISSIILKVICACSSVDRALASGARCVGSIPIRRIKKCFTAGLRWSIFLSGHMKKILTGRGKSCYNKRAEIKTQSGW